MCISTQSFVGVGAHESFFESEPWPQMGLLTLGAPMILTTFTLALVAWDRHRRRRPHALTTGDFDSARACEVSASRVLRPLCCLTYSPGHPMRHAGWRLKPRLDGLRATKPAYAGWACPRL
jgi:hypothetical protein